MYPINFLNGPSILLRDIRRHHRRLLDGELQPRHSCSIEFGRFLREVQPWAFGSLIGGCGGLVEEFAEGDAVGCLVDVEIEGGCGAVGEIVVA